MATYSIGGRSAATAATANHAAAGIWNPHATDRIRIKEIWISVPTAAAAVIGLLRNTTRGTAGSTVTPAIQNADGRDVAPVSGFLLDLATYSAQPTLDSATAYQWRWNLPATAGAGIIAVFNDPIIVPPGAGIVVVTPTATVFPACDFTFIIED